MKVLNVLHALNMKIDVRISVQDNEISDLINLIENDNLIHNKMLRDLHSSMKPKY